VTSKSWHSRTVGVNWFGTLPGRLLRNTNGTLRDTAYYQVSMTDNPNLSQRSLGLLRRILEEMEPDDIYSVFDRKKFWKDTLFDAGFATRFIDVASTYNFRWSNIIPDLFVGEFADKNSRIPADSDVCEQALKALLEFAIDTNGDTPLGDELRASVISDGFDLKAGSGVDSSIPAELAQLPGKKNLVSDLQRKLDARELVSVLYMDLDGFKAVNDTSGHTEGDKCLIRIARIINETILGKGKLYRPGGDEFVALLPNFNCGEALGTAERIRAAIDADNPGGSLKVTVSIGVASSESAFSNGEDLIGLADKAMYAAKKAKNCVAVG
jgi:diguanylate cyclase (GGDEF)-like protein